VASQRWGEVTVKKQAGAKNEFDGSKSFSIVDVVHEFSLEQLRVILERAVDLTQTYDFSQLLAILDEMKKKGAKENGCKRR
jgi:uncharacterized protein YpiB (UPF0302 family)